MTGDGLTVKYLKPLSLPGQLMEPFQRFFKKIVRGSYPLLITTLLAIIWANVSPSSYLQVWHTELTISLGHWEISRSLLHWIDEALMTLFFFVVGLEIKREILVGELASPGKALLPIAAAAGGMLFPAGIYLLLNGGSPSAHGWGIPMATDIAFSLAVLAFLRERVPLGLRIFLSAFAIADDLGAVLVIALFYTRVIFWNYLLVAGFFLAGLVLANILWVRGALAYALLGLGLWLAVLGSGVHATAAGVVVAMFIPARGKYDTETFINKVKDYLHEFECQPGSCGYTILLNEQHLNTVQSIDLACYDVETPLQRLEHALQSWISYVILPLFALANAGIALGNLDLPDALMHPLTQGVVLGLVIGKPVGITLFSYLAARLLKAPLPAGVGWGHILGAGLLGGIGFTMSLFISGLSFDPPEYAELAKLGIIVGSLLAGAGGLALLWYRCRLDTGCETEPLGKHSEAHSGRE